MEVDNVAAFLDAHYPLTHPIFWDTALSAKQTPPLFNWLEDFKPTTFILGGDNLDLDQISFFNKAKPKLTEGRRLSKDYEGFNKILDRLDAILDKTCKRKITLTGNHEWRVTALIESDPASYEGLIEWEDNLHLAERGWEVIERGHTCQVGKMYFHHGDFKNGYMPINHAKYAVQLFRRNIFYGHVHTNQEHVETSPIDTHPLLGRAVGMVGQVNPAWMLNRPSAWQNSFLSAYVEPSGNFWHQVTNIIENQFVYAGFRYHL